MNSSTMLKEIRICGSIVGSLFLNEIKQVFTNNSDDTVEFVYTFPIPENASICKFSAFTENNSFTGCINTKEGALKEHQTELSKGNSVYILESWRDNIFKIPLGNVAKGEDVTVEIAYIQDIIIKDSAFRLLIPTPEADYISPAPGETDANVSFSIKLDLENHIREISSPSHNISVEYKGNKGTVAVNSVDANSDFVLNVLLHDEYSEKFITSQSASKEYFSYISFIPKLEPTDHTNSNVPYLNDIRVESTIDCNLAYIPPKHIYDGECCTLIIKSDKAIDSLSIIGMNGEIPVRTELRVSDSEGNAELLKKIWGKKKIAQMESDLLGINPRDEKIFRKRNVIIQYSEYFKVVCRYTRYVVENNHGKKRGLLSYDKSELTREVLLDFFSKPYEKPSMIAMISHVAPNDEEQFDLTF